jgi:hypothetical protein
MKKINFVYYSVKREKNFLALLPMITISRYSGCHGTNYVVYVGVLMFTATFAFVR